MINYNQNIKLVLILSFLFITYFSFSQNNKEVIGTDSYFEFEFQNDFFFKTDYYFSNGIALNFIFPSFKKFPLSKTLIPTKSQSTDYYGISIVQELYTPVKTNLKSIPFNDRPYSSIMYLGYKRSSFIEQTGMKISNEIIIGIIGSYSYGEITQSKFHEAINNDIPAGWDNQVANDLILNYEYDIEVEIIGNSFFELLGNSIIHAGTLYDDASVGIKLRLGYFNPNYTGFGQMNTKRIGTETIKKFQFYTFINPSAKLVLYNGTLQGGMFNRKSIYVLKNDELKPVVLSLNAGIIMQYSWFQLKLEISALSPEFRGGYSHKYGNVGIRINF